MNPSAILKRAILAVATFLTTQAAQADLVTTDPSLPPLNEVYETADDVHARYSGPGLTVVLNKPQHKPIALEVRLAIGADEEELFFSELNGTADVIVGAVTTPGVPIQANGMVRTRVLGKVGNVTGTFQTEMLSMDLSGTTPLGPYMIRESPTLASTGQTTITDIGGGQYRITSFFEVFTEMSVDGGQNWFPADGPARVELQGAPSAPNVLLTDNFDGTGTPNTLDLNFNLAGRQTGSLAPVTYTLNPNGNCQVGNGGEPHDGGNVLLCAFGSNGALNHNFNGANSVGGLTISFELDPNSHVDHANTTDWGAVAIGSSEANRNTFVVSETPHFGILFRANGHIQAFDGGAVVSPDPEPNWAPDGNYSGELHHFDLVMTDPNDGNPFDGSGDTQIDVYVDGNVSPVYTFTKVGGYADNYVNFQGAFIVDFENLNIVQPHPPASSPVVISLQPESKCVAEGESVTFTVSASGIPAPTFQWKKNGAIVPGATSPTLIISPVSGGDAGDYVCEVTNPSGTVSSAVARLSVGLAMNNPGFELDTFTLFPGYVSGNGPITGWNALGGHGINPGGGSPFANNGAIPQGSQVAFLQADGALSQVVSGFNPGEDYYVQYYENSRQGDAATDPALAVTIGGTTIVPAHAVPPVGGSNPYRRVISDVFTATAGDLELAFIKSNPQGGDNTALVDSVCVVRLTPGTPPILLRDPIPLIVQVGETATFSVRAQGSSPLTYQWRKNGQNINVPNSPTLTLNNVQKSDEARYSVEVSNGAGMAISAEAQLTVFEPIPDLFNTGVNDSRVPLADNQVDPHYLLFQNPDTGSADAIVEDSTVFPIVGGPWLANNATSKWIGPQFNTAGSAVGVYIYRTMIDLTGRDPSTVVIIGRWSVDNVGRDIQVNGVSTGNPQNPNFTVYTPFTIDSSNASFVAGLNTIDFIAENVQAPGYTGLRVEIDKSNVLIPAGTAPQITGQPQGRKAAVGDTVTFTVSATGTSPLHYQWRKDGVDLPGENGQTLTLTGVAPADSGLYSVIVANNVNSVGSDDAGLCVCLQPIPVIFGTGVDKSGALLADGEVDPHYLLTLSDDPNYPGPDALVINQAWPIAPAGPWVANGPRSRWIAPRAEQDQTVDLAFGNAAGNYAFTTTFDLSGYDETQVQVIGQWSVDNLGTDILVNGVNTGITSPGFGGYTPFTITTGFLPGLNTLEFDINNLPNTPNPAGLRVDLTGLVTIRPQLHIRRLGGSVVISWVPNCLGQKLQSAPDVTGPWTDVVGATTPYTTPASGFKRFFRLLQ